MIRPATFEDATVVVDTNIISLMMSDQPADRFDRIGWNGVTRGVKGRWDRISCLRRN